LIADPSKPTQIKVDLNIRSMGPISEIDRVSDGVLIKVNMLEETVCILNK